MRYLVIRHNILPTSIRESALVRPKLINPPKNSSIEKLQNPQTNNPKNPKANRWHAPNLITQSHELELIVRNSVAQQRGE